ncbi:hypothetical protein PR048_014913 [Dryococelus australis]|uniref:Uncharacterized protein n=1 Tax=Dryococelus australis TaxID=614101 RepID=A0ABQ9HFN5_9NEOP|nr:hypothetical protein PR048_014913 [Dryococelus australis]
MPYKVKGKTIQIRQLARRALQRELEALLKNVNSATSKSVLPDSIPLRKPNQPEPYWCKLKSETSLNSVNPDLPTWEDPQPSQATHLRKTHTHLKERAGEPELDFIRRESAPTHPNRPALQKWEPRVPSKVVKQQQLLLLCVAEHTGDWKMHLYCAKEMLPHLHAAGHFHYAKSAHLYVQQMEELDSKLQPEELQKHTEWGIFTIRCSHNVWSVVWTDMAIEQDLMRPMKVQGALTHGISCSTSEQHVELSKYKCVADARDAYVFCSWLDNHSPWDEYDCLRSIDSWVVGDEKINCDSSVSVGTEEESLETNGKIKPHLRDIASIFNNPSATVEDITSAREKFTMYLYTSENLHACSIHAGHIYRSECGSKCSCSIAGLSCSIICMKCRGRSSLNGVEDNDANNPDHL